MDNYIKPQKKTAVSLLKSELATRETASYISEFYTCLPNPDPVLRKAGIHIPVLREVRRDTRVSSATRSRKSGTYKRHSRLVSNGASDATVKFIEDIFANLNMRGVIAEILDYFGFGYQICEVVWGVDGRDLIPVKIQGKPQEWFRFSPENHLLFCPQNLANPQPVEPYKFLLTQNEAEYMNPYGVGAFSDCFWPVTFKKGGVKFWARFIEKYGMPHVAGALPRSASQTDRDKLLDALTLLLQNSVSVTPDDATINLMEADKTSSTDAYREFCAYHNAEISIAILGHEGSTTATPGRLGNDEAAIVARDDLIDADCENVAQTINTLVRWIIELNPHRASAGIPHYDIYEDETVDKTLAERDQILSLTGLKFREEYYKRMYNLSDADFEVGPRQAAQFAAPGEEPATPPANENALIHRAQREITADRLIGTIRAMADTADSLEEFQALLLDSYRQIDETENAAALETALTAAELAGRYDIMTATGLAKK